MRQVFSWSWSYIRHYAGRSSLIVLSLTMLLFLPFGVNRLIKKTESRMMSRAESTPLVVTASEGGTDELIEALYFKNYDGTAFLEYAVLDSLNDSGLGRAIPMMTGFNARSYSICGTQISYFKFRDLKPSEGNFFQYLGDCVLGAQVATELGLSVGDSIISSPENFFDLAGVYPLKMRISGILESVGNPDDRTIFTDVRTVWIIMGLGHGHQDVERISDPTILPDSQDSILRTTAKIKMYQEITEKNRDEFHFHGDLGDMPLTSLIFVPQDEKSLAIMRGRFAEKKYPWKALVPSEVVEKLLGSVFRLGEAFRLFYIWVSAASAIIFAILIGLLLRIRQEQIQTLFQLGASRGLVYGMLMFEWLILLFASGLGTWALWLLTGRFTDYFIQWIVL
jgi:putative ABC transport system permease protein